MLSRVIACPVVAQTPGDASYFFGFHDLSPWSPDDRLVVLHRYASDLSALPSGGDVAEIVVWDRMDDSFSTVGETTTWNLQQGARACWVGSRERTVAFNKLVNGVAGCELVDLSTGERRRYPFTIGALSPDERFALSPHFGRLGRYWKAYGYQGLPPAPGLDEPAPTSDGIWRLDLETGEVRLVISIAELAKTDTQHGASAPYRFVTHVSFNPSGSRIVFYDRNISKDGALYSRLLSARPDGTDLIVLAEEKVSHFAWLDNETLLVWMRKSALPIGSLRRSGMLASPAFSPFVALARRARGRIKGALLQECYYELDTRKSKRPKAFAPSLFPEDGHPMLSPDGNWIALDTYPDATGRIPLMLYDRRAGQKLSVGSFEHGVTTRDGDLKCDFHPRWNRAGLQISGDVCAKGRRSMVIVDVAPVVAC